LNRRPSAASGGLGSSTGECSSEAAHRLDAIDAEIRELQAAQAAVLKAKERRDALLEAEWCRDSAVLEQRQVEARAHAAENVRGRSQGVRADFLPPHKRVGAAACACVHYSQGRLWQEQWLSPWWPTCRIWWGRGAVASGSMQSKGRCPSGGVCLPYGAGATRSTESGRSGGERRWYGDAMPACGGACAPWSRDGAQRVPPEPYWSVLAMLCVQEERVEVLKERHELYTKDQHELQQARELYLRMTSTSSDTTSGQRRR